MATRRWVLGLQLKEGGIVHRRASIDAGCHDGSVFNGWTDRAHTYLCNCHLSTFLCLSESISIPRGWALCLSSGYLGQTEFFFGCDGFIKLPSYHCITVFYNLFMAVRTWESRGGLSQEALYVNGFECEVFCSFALRSARRYYVRLKILSCVFEVIVK